MYTFALKEQSLPKNVRFFFHLWSLCQCNLSFFDENCCFIYSTRHFPKKSNQWKRFYRGTLHFHRISMKCVASTTKVTVFTRLFRLRILSSFSRFFFFIILIPSLFPSFRFEFVFFLFLFLFLASSIHSFFHFFSIRQVSFHKIPTFFSQITEKLQSPYKTPIWALRKCIKVSRSWTPTRLWPLFFRVIVFILSGKSESWIETICFIPLIT